MERQRRSLIFSPGLRALARYPVKRNAIFGVTLKGLPRFFFFNRDWFLRTPSEFAFVNQRRYPGRCPGLEFANASGVWIKQVCHCPTQGQLCDPNDCSLRTLVFDASCH